MAASWPMSRRRFRCRWSTTSCARSWSLSSSICATMLWSRCRTSSTSSRMAIWLTTSYCWSRAHSISAPSRSWYPSVIRWVASSRWRPSTWPQRPPSSTMRFWWTRLWPRSLSTAFRNRIWMRWTLRSFVIPCTRHIWRHSTTSARTWAAPRPMSCARS